MNSRHFFFHEITKSKECDEMFVGEDRLHDGQCRDNGEFNSE